MEARCYPIDGPWSGRLYIVPRPRGGDWLTDEITAWRLAGLTVMVSTLTPAEAEEMQLSDERAEAGKHGIEFVSFPIADRATPESFAASEELFRRLLERLNKGKHVGVHCRQGVGRSSLIAAASLILAGVPADETWARVEGGRGCGVPDTPEQKAWVDRFTRTVMAEAR
jgi:rhodanese-related sulfurtransferase